MAGSLARLPACGEKDTNHTAHDKLDSMT
jgi:hypothetical protein